MYINVDSISSIIEHEELHTLLAYPLSTQVQIVSSYWDVVQ